MRIRLKMREYEKNVWISKMVGTLYEIMVKETEQDRNHIIAHSMAYIVNEDERKQRGDCNMTALNKSLSAANINSTLI